MREYAGIGARKTPTDILIEMTRIAKKLATRGYRLRSGGAIGADTAFEMGCEDAKQIFYADQARSEWVEHAAQFHPTWNRVSEYGKKLHARNSAIMLGSDLNDPVEFVVCWTPNGEIVGGTGQAIRVALAYKIPVYNLFTVGIFNA